MTGAPDDLPLAGAPSDPESDGASDDPVGRPEHEVTIRSMRYPFTGRNANEQVDDGQIGVNCDVEAA